MRFWRLLICLYLFFNTSGWIKLRFIQEVQFEPGRTDSLRIKMCTVTKFRIRLRAVGGQGQPFSNGTFLPQLDTKCFSVVSDALAPNTVQLRPSRDEACQARERDFVDLKHPCILRGTFQVSAEFNYSCTCEGKLVVWHFTWRPNHVSLLPGHITSP